jgi:hypothetical protein
MLHAVKFSGAPHSVRHATLNALSARGRWPHEDGPANGVICVSLEGMMYGNEDGSGNVVRSTARWRTRQALKHGYWRKLREANSWSNCPKCGAERATGKCAKCSYVGRSKTPEGKANFDEFCRPSMYEIDIEKFRAAERAKGLPNADARTYQEYKEAAKQPTDISTRKPAQAAPTPVNPPPPEPAKPAAEHRSTQRADSRAYERTRALRAGVLADMTKLMSDGAAEDAALQQVCRTWGVTAGEAQTILKECLFRPPRVASGTESPPKRYVDACPACGSELAQNLGPGPRLICPQCRK